MVVLRLITTFVAKKNPENQFWRDIAQSLILRTRFWVLICMIFDSSFIRICFNCFNQLSHPVAYDFESKINLVATYTTLFFLVCYSLFSYTFIRRYHVNSAENLLAFSLPDRQGYILENLNFSFSRILRAFCHSNLILLHETKLKALLSVDIIMIIVVLKLRKSFFNKATFIVELAYKICFACMNLFTLFLWKGSTNLTDKTL